MITPPKSPETSAPVRRPDENNHPTLDDDILNEGKQLTLPGKPANPPEQDFPGFEDEQEPPPEPDDARA